MAELEMNEEEKREPEETRSSVKLAAAGETDRAYADTMEALVRTEYSLPEFSSSYDEQINELYNKIISREPFRYDPMSDSLYGQYREQYARMGRLAMADSMGKAAALTGGYGNSYGQRLGQQEYDAYLQKLGDVMPELYGAAYQRYKDRGAALEDEYERLNGLRESEYGRYRDQVADVKYQQGMAADREKADADRMDKNYDRLVELITKTGYSPSPEELEQSGMTQAQADAYLSRYGGGGGSGGSSGGYYYGGSSKKSGLTKAEQKLRANTGSAAMKLYSEAIRGKIK